jgi:nucleotide-binding universal stress UspA family protein
MSWFHKKCIVVPFDFSEASFDAIRHAMQLVDAPANITAVNVLPPLVAGDPGFRWDVMDEATRRQQIEASLAEHDIAGVEVRVQFGDAGEQIVAAAEAKRADLIIIPSHCRHGIAHLLLGSVAERVVRLAHCDVLVLRINNS